MCLEIYIILKNKNTNSGIVPKSNYFRDKENERNRDEVVFSKPEYIKKRRGEKMI